jgi:hypothetical protein
VLPDRPHQIRDLVVVEAVVGVSITPLFPRLLLHREG